MTKLHLGCGERYFEGYINIDFPLEAHTVQKTTVADEYHNLLELRYPKESIDEVRLHHVFEHFDRPTAMALLFAWNSWLKQEGLLRIEVPDFFFSSLLALSPFLSKRTHLVATRHIFGSHEAPWAIHCEGWTKSSLKEAFKLAGFQIIKTKRNYWRGTVNLEVTAKKYSSVNEQGLSDFFTLYTLDNSSSELLLKEKWLNLFTTQYKKMIFSER